MALRARLLHREDAALEPHLAASVAGVAGIELAVLGPGALARLALGQGRDLDPALDAGNGLLERSEEHTSELQSLMRISYSVVCFNKHQYTEKNICQKLRAETVMKCLHGQIDQ